MRGGQSRTAPCRAWQGARGTGVRGRGSGSDEAVRGDDDGDERHGSAAGVGDTRTKDDSRAVGAGGSLRIGAVAARGDCGASAHHHHQ